MEQNAMIEREKEALRARWDGLEGQGLVASILAERFYLTPNQRVQVIDNNGLITDLTGINLRERQLDNAMVIDVDLRAADFTDSTFSSSVIQYSNADLCSFDQAHLKGVEFWKSHLHRISFVGAQLEKVTFQECDTSALSFKNATLTGVLFNHVDLSNCNFENAKFAGCDMYAVRLSEQSRQSLLALGEAACKITNAEWV